MVQGFQGGDGRPEFHPVVGGAGKALGEFEPVLSADQHHADPSGSRIAPAGAVSMNIDFLQEPPSIDINGIENSTDFIISKNTSNVVPDRRSDEGGGFAKIQL